MILSAPWLSRAIQLFAAASIALIVAAQLGLQNPYWAAMPVWVVAQAYREDLVLRAVLRIGGTVFGAAIGWSALTMIEDPMFSILVLIFSVGAGAAATFWIGTIYSYGMLLAAITVAVVLIPALDHSVDTAQLAADRIWCTLIGVFVVTAITFAFTPPRPEPPPRRAAPPPWVTLRHGAIAAGAALLGIGLLKLIGGPAGISAAMALCIFSMLIAGSRYPAPILRYMPVGATIGVGAALAYRALDMILPDPATMSALLAVPFIAIGAVLRSHPRSAPIGLDANMCFLLAAEAGAAGHGLSAHLQGGIALVLTAFLFTALFRHIGVVS